MNGPTSGTAIVVTNGQYREIYAKTAHGLVRGPSRFCLVGIIDETCSGRDAGELLDGRHRGVPVFRSVRSSLDRLPERPDYCVIGVATKGGVVPPGLRRDLLEAAQAGLTIVNGLHQLLSDDAEVMRFVEQSGGGVLDIRKPRPFAELRFWTGEVLQIPAPRVAVLGTDCAMGKRTTAALLQQELARRGMRAAVIYTGQTGWLQGWRHGFILDATPNDFVPGELEGAIVECYREERPQLFLIEGQSGLRNPSGPCGSELIISAGANGVILHHAPGRLYYKGFEQMAYAMPPLGEEIELIRLFGAPVWAVALNIEGLPQDEGARLRSETERETGIPVVLPLVEGVGRLAEIVERQVNEMES